MGKDLAVKGVNAVTKGGAVGRGLTNIRVEKLKLHRMKLGQGQSDEVKAGRCQQGEYINNITLQNLGPRVEFIPILQTFSRTLWTPLSDGGGRECLSRDGMTGNKYGDCRACGRADKWRKNEKTGADQPPECSDQDNYLVMVRGCQSGPMLFSFTKSGTQAGQKLNSILTPDVAQGRDIWGKAFVLTSEQKTYGKNSCFIPRVSLATDGPTEEEMAMAEALYQQYAPKADEVTEAATAEDLESETQADAPGARSKGGSSRRI